MQASSSPVSGVAEVQGTVRGFAAATRSGSVFLDDGAEVSFGAAAFDRGGLRLLRPGQRVRLEIEAGQVRLLTIATLTA